MLRPARRPGYRNRVGSPNLIDRVALTQALSELGEQIELTLIQSRDQFELFKDLIVNFHYL